VKPKLLAAGGAALLALGLLGSWVPLAARRTQASENQVERAIAAGEVQVSPAELATLMHNRQMALAIFDLRDEAAFNRFHLADAHRLVDKDLADVRALPDKTVKMLVADNDEAALAVLRALRRLGTRQVYVLAGGVTAWLALFAPSSASGAVLAGAMGDRHPASLPDIEHVALPTFVPKVKLGSGGVKKSAGCGG
jgi:rhodanese-related sulfurtransferase